MLLLYSRGNVDWSKVYLTVMLGLVNKSGAWDLELVRCLQKMGVYNSRIRHISERKNVYEKARHIYDKLVELSFGGL